MSTAMALPPTREQVEQQLSSPSPPVYSPLFNSPPGVSTDYIGRPIPTSRRTNSFSSCAPSDSEELSTSPTSTSAAQLSAISELSDAIGSGSDVEDSDSSSVGNALGLGREASGSRPRLALSSPALSRIAEQEAHGRSAEQLRLSESAVITSGYLLKKGERRKAWKKRWFVLRAGQLAMYKNEKEYQLLRLIPAADIHSCNPVQLKKHQFTFAIVTPRRTYYVKASGDKEREEWCAALEQAKEEARAAATLTGSIDTPRQSLSRADTGLQDHEEERQMPTPDGATAGAKKKTGRISFSLQARA